jgi:hypothetical protein
MEGWYNLHTNYLTASILLKELLQEIIEAIARSILLWHSSDVKSACFQPFMVSFLGHFTVVHLVGNPGISSCLLDEVDREKCVNENHDYMKPTPVI